MANFNPYQSHPSFVDRSAMQTPAQAAQPRPLYFISRNNGVLVPLLPADELPYTIRLQGLPRVLRFDQTVGMQHVGTAPYTGMTFKIEDEGAHRSTSQPPCGHHARSQSAVVNPVKKYLAPDALARQALAQTANNQHAPVTALEASNLSAHEASSNWRSTASTSRPTTSNTTQSIIDAIVSTASGAAEAVRVGYIPRLTVAPPSGAQPDQDKKEYCTYWIRTGECDYMQQGCLYKHEMPDKATLEKIGLGRNLPRWWIEKQSGVKLGAREPQIVGPLMKSSEWLKRKPTGRDASDASGESSESDDEIQSSSGRRSMASSQSSEAASKNATTVMSTGESKATVFKDKTSREVEDVSDCEPPFDIRKASTTSDLIDFDPLLPTPSSCSPSIAPEKSIDSSSGTTHISQTTSCPAQMIKDDNTTKLASQRPAATATATKIFVPKGESADHHAAEARKRAACQYERRGAPVSSMGSVQPLEKQIQDMQKAKLDKSGRKHAETAKLSKNAAKPAASSSSEQGKEEKKKKLGAADGSKRNAKTGNRIRRPAKVTPVKHANSPVPAVVTILKKSEK
ncbi:hypothetical protein KC318_g11039 [Hortaea werneckii]|nr:hypothetical protein KC334_g1322 [Hortaea werneckii]KAI7010499.1 hypothetical protein KC355_g6148 [Hortaea werneckii]KAI7658762.1 hypothetical protein KC318_g11039 [Hortaea werneckii]